MAFMKMTKGTLGLFAGVALAAFCAVRGCQEAMEPNAPGETNTQQFFRGAAKAPVEAVQGAIEGVTSAFDSHDVTRALEQVDEAGRKIDQGVRDYQQGHGGSSSRGSGQIGVELPDYVPGEIPGGPPPAEDDKPQPNH
ncbi:MAG: hypothetical protein H6858_03775 [Rhodospirillales bacterium]|nr:hypothetical protein [Alphaproteobacteria bacterium]MCB1841148.1 hypothetical protein [Alphaproteobacteria bacterium]MCB9976704.1 hypothetical protein [Rhodospirillales bacterium]